MDGPTGIFGDLLTIEVSTIIKDSISAHKMPSLPFALHDIIEAYARALIDLEVDLEPYLAPTSDELWLRLTDNPNYVGKACDAYATATGKSAESPDERRDLYNYVADLWPVLDRERNPHVSTPEWSFSMVAVSNGWDSFERLRIAAHQALEQRRYGKPDEAMLSRITGSCARLKYIVQGLQRCDQTPTRRSSWRNRDLACWGELIPRTRDQLLQGDLRNKAVPLDLMRPEHRATVRKIWEVGTERVVAQTSVQVDGDVITRISEDLIKQHSEVVRGLILQAHRDSVDTSLQHWKALVEVAIKLFSDLLGRRQS